MSHKYVKQAGTDECGECGLPFAPLHILADYQGPTDEPPAPPADLGVDMTHLKVPCPTCGASPHYDCRGKFGSYVAGHAARREAARGAA